MGVRLMGTGSVDNHVLITAEDTHCFIFLSPPPPQNVWTKVRNAVKAWSPFRVQFKKKSYPWVQLAGHEGKPGWKC